MKLGQILIHGKKYISIENIYTGGENEIYKKEAGTFASNIVLSEKEENEIHKNKALTTNEIVFYAEKIWNVTCFYNW
ncbi:hypothetical protein [Formosa sp. L2A11]|uniref:hypothetical protein n=1 Tax=Formosa sp. L2A11 TaxID=2686363 RepID=UPI00131B3D59|nr:hypothetical protein [Formosa sp. L2A11]